mmetsp:Transcript_97889/g.204140  ORF Transcript_97889/g.204140 Transcript_97889/m.204140 type:complete len:411 (+) Transcript_97889:146-1378(+)|eukprot:CAMPEP_0206480258 /NCGR_PEP_ID=MMETSP0324_2-20121206/37160_1 /ASSEMBLY_ACC=CAM_ASM_000836 /TAXON_ID=2866 /ORGANISM="Crypthecodinium cohnii, Strain Seligo" /LENGTH=410 /DNA_ID=CAMNT_0053956957 /DNA_START=63 /DNA_END=1295 /DNA_ORIENTATION=+
MERGKEHEVVFEYTPEPVGPRVNVVGAKGPMAASSRLAASSAAAARENENIDTGALNTRNAMNIFFKKECEAAAAERAAAASEAQRQRQAVQEATQLPVNMGEKQETLDHRCARLQVECLELLRCCESSSMGDEKARRELMAGDTTAIANELRALEKLLRGWRKGATATAATVEEVSGVSGPGAMTETLAGQLDRLASGDTGSKATSSSKGAPDEKLVSWEVNFAPSTIPIIESSQIATLENSLAEMEKKIGSTGAKEPDIYPTMVTLHQRMGLLDPQKLESMRTIASKAKTGLEQAIPQKEQLPPREPAVDKKVKELYDSCQRWMPVAANLPASVTRMQSLEGFHQLSASFTSRLGALEQEQEELMKVLEVTNMAIADLSRGMQENMIILKENLEALDAKVSKKKGWFG